MALADIAVGLETVAQAEAPLVLIPRPGDDALYVAEQAGTVRRLVDGELEQPPVLDLTGQISSGGERGLLGLAFSSDGGTLYTSYTDSSGDSRLDRYAMAAEVADPASGRNLLTVEQPFPNHNGGNVILGPDGMLYLGLGDGGAAGDPHRNAQDPASPLGKILRLDPDDGAAPPDNPFIDDDGYDPRVYALGLRNPWRFSFDRATGDLWVGDVGQDSVEEINVTRAGRSAGRNYGWDIFEGSQPFEGDELPPRSVQPVYEYPTAQGCAVTGGFVYRGDEIAGLQGAYLFSDYCSGTIQALRVAGGEVVDQADLAQSEQVTSFAEDADGELYVLSQQGAISRVTER